MQISGRLSLLDYGQRLLQVLAVATRLLATVLHRRWRRRPAEGPRMVREALEELSGAFLKFGQILSLQIDTLPREYCDALLGLLDRVPPFPPDQVDRIFLEELNASPRKLYREFEYQPLGSASIGQVHKAVLEDGRAVAVKVQRPGVRAVFERDNRLMQFMVRLVFLFRIRRLYFMRDPVRELAMWTKDELDYRREAAHCAALGRNAVHTPSERVPQIHWRLTTARVLTMDYLEGPSVAEYLRMIEQHDEARLAELRQQGFVPQVFSSNVITNFLSDAFRFGVFHADLHPANLLILPNNVVGYVDFGIVAVLTPEARRRQIELTLAYSSGDSEAIYRGFLNICMVGEDADLAGMRRKIEELARQWYHEPAVGGRVRFRVTVTKTMMDFLSVCQDYGVLVDREMIKYIRSTILADGLVSRLAPGFDLAQALRQVVESYLAEERRHHLFSRGGALWLMTDLALWMEAGPRALLHAMNLIERRQLPLRVGFRAASNGNGALRRRALGAAAVWGISALYLGWAARAPSGSGPGRFTMLAAAFVALWTIWLLHLLQRLKTR